MSQERRQTGRTDAEVGAEPCLSARTVERHLRKVLANLGLGSRKELRDAPNAHSHELTLESLLEAGARSGSIRADISAADMFAALTGIAPASGEPEQRDQAGRLLDLTMDGLRS
ncbi:hypothetical protein ACFFV7_25960 [Nonomuraea spiralis]|uniref:Transcriptional regulator SbtR-like C-terminal domain-containing protein n=1 Tax=Nonomuraea spiralis TaxID=46182 RepID=A0ABV5IJF4_9ACTN|nr:hypothetical protein [Nonomuraea spiralis]